MGAATHTSIAGGELLSFLLYCWLGCSVCSISSRSALGCCGVGCCWVTHAGENGPWEALPSTCGDGDCAYAQAVPSRSGEGDRLNKLGTAMSMLSMGERREKLACMAAQRGLTAHVQCAAMTCRRRRARGQSCRGHDCVAYTQQAGLRTMAEYNMLHRHCVYCCYREYCRLRRGPNEAGTRSGSAVIRSEVRREHPLVREMVLDHNVHAEKQLWEALREVR